MMASTQPQTPSSADVAEAREAVATRLDRLARRVRAGTTTDIKTLDDAYSEIVKLAHRIVDILG